MKNNTYCVWQSHPSSQNSDSQTCEKLHATHQVEACRDMVIIIPFRKPQLSFFNNEMYELQLN